jgi:hypothetical protein
VRRLRALSEKECYLRCYGAGDVMVRVVKLEPRTSLRSGLTITGEELRRLFELRLDAREAVAA